MCPLVARCRTRMRASRADKRSNAGATKGSLDASLTKQSSHARWVWACTEATASSSHEMFGLYTGIRTEKITLLFGASEDSLARLCRCKRNQGPYLSCPGWPSNRESNRRETPRQPSASQMPLTLLNRLIPSFHFVAPRFRQLKYQQCHHQRKNKHEHLGCPYLL